MNLLNNFSFELPTKIEYGIGVVEKVHSDSSNFLISHRPTQTYTDKIISSGDIARGKTVCPAGKQLSN